MTDPSGAYSLRMFVDTSAYFAVANRRDASHEPAGALMRRLVAEQWCLFTTNFVLAEVHALLTRLDLRVAAGVLAEVGLTMVVRASARDERRAREIVFGYTHKDYSLTDAASFVVMEPPRRSPSTTTLCSTAGC